MATAKKTVIPPVPVVENFTVTLELSKEEAKLVRDVLYVVGGLPDNTRRRYAATVLYALDSVLGCRTKTRVADMDREHSSIYFTSPEEQ